jgi:hypothetical protein
MIFQGFTLGQTIDARVRAEDQSGNKSGYTVSSPVSMTTDTTAPNQPSSPTVTGVLAGIRIVWNGLDTSGNPMPADFDHYAVYVSTSSGFSPSSATLVDSLPTAGGATTYSSQSYGSTLYVLIVAYDRSGNGSIPSAQVSGVPQQAVNTDILNAAITNAKIATAAIDATKIQAAAVTTAAIAAAAVTAGQIASQAVTADKLTQASLGDNRVLNGTFEDPNSAGTGPAAWSIATYLQTGSPSYQWQTAINGSKSIGVTSGTSDGGAWQSSVFSVTPGEKLSVKLLVEANATSGANIYVRVFFLSATQSTVSTVPAAATQVSAVDITTGAVTTPPGGIAFAGNVDVTSAWNPGTTDVVCLTGQITVPAGAQFAGLILYNWEGAASTVYFDDVNVQPVIYGPAIANAAINTAQIANAAVGTAQIANAAVGTAQIANAAVGTAQIANASITSALIGTAAVGSAQIADAAVGTAEIADAAIVAAKIGSAQILTAAIANLAVTQAQIGSCSITSLTGGTLNYDMVIGARIKTADSGPRCELNATGLQIYSDYSGSPVITLSGSSQTITGAIIQTATSGTRVVISPSVSISTAYGSYPGVALIDSSGNVAGVVNAGSNIVLQSPGGGNIVCQSSGGNIINGSTVMNGTFYPFSGTDLGTTGQRFGNLWVTNIGANGTVTVSNGVNVTGGALAHASTSSTFSSSGLITLSPPLGLQITTLGAQRPSSSTSTLPWKGTSDNIQYLTINTSTGQIGHT